MFLIAAIQKIANPNVTSNIHQLLQALFIAAMAGTLTKKKLKKLKRKIFWQALKLKVKSYFKKPNENNDKLFGINKWAVIIGAAAIFILLTLLFSIITAIVVVGMLFLMAWVYTTYLMPKEE